MFRVPASPGPGGGAEQASQAARRASAGLHWSGRPARSRAAQAAGRARRAGAHVVVQVEAHEGRAAVQAELREVAQVAHGLAVEAQHLHVVQLLVAQRRVAGQHLRQHDHLRARGGPPSARAVQSQ